jgi:hypothetical protein
MRSNPQSDALHSSIINIESLSLVYEWTHPARTGPIGDNCTPSPPRRYTHSNRQRLVVCEGKLRWISLYKWLLRELSWPFRVQGGRRGDRTTQVIFRHQSLETAIYLCVLQPLEADVYLCVSCACFGNLKLTYTLYKPRRNFCYGTREIFIQRLPILYFPRKIYDF